MSEHQYHRHRDQSQIRRFLRTYRFEILWLSLVVIGVFLVLEPWNIRKWLIGWFDELILVRLYRIVEMGGTAINSLAQATFSDTIGYLLILVALVMIALRVRWRLMHNPALTVLRCPQCDGTIHRAHRRTVDRLIGLYVPVRRYRCANAQCHWHGLRVGTGHGSSRASARRSS